MFKFLHHLLNPHCPHCRAEKLEEQRLAHINRIEEREEIKEETVCQSCETLIRQLEIANSEKQQLLARLLEKPEVPVHTGPPPMTLPRNIPFQVRRQMLEQEDRRKAELLRKAPKPEPVVVKDNEELETEVLGEAKENV